MSSKNFEKNISDIDLIIAKLENGELTLDESIKEYEKAMKLLKNASEILNVAEGKIIKVTSNNDEINLEVDENA